jgi:acyl-CoA oxidase
VLTGNYLREQFKLMQEGFTKGDFKQMPVMHHLLAGMKASYSDAMMECVELSRVNCGGAGYQSGSGFSELHAGSSPIPVFEGDNTVMLLQSARFVFKLVKTANKGKPLPYPFNYIGQAKELAKIKNKGKSVAECMDLEFIQRALQVRAIN